MSDDRVDQVEYRWQPQHDLSPIAWSGDGLRHKWENVLRHYVGVGVEPGAPAPTESAVYFANRRGEAALVLRYRKRYARPVAAQVEEGRNSLVTRALIGPVEHLTPELAFCLCRSPFPELLGPVPGDVQPGGRLAPVSAADLRAQVGGVALELSQQAKIQPGLARLIEARLREPDRRVLVFLTDDAVARPLRDAPVVPLLWGLFQTAGRVLEGVQPALPWNTSFSTFEPPFREGNARKMPNLVFQARTDAPGPPGVRLALDLPEETPGSGLGRGLALAYREIGDGLHRYLDDAAAASTGLSGRLTRLRGYDDLRGYWGTRDPAPREYVVQVRKPVTPDQKRLLGLYQVLYDTRGRPDPFTKALALIMARSAMGQTLAAGDCTGVLGQFHDCGWYAGRLRPDELALVIKPFLLGLLEDVRVFDQDRWPNLPAVAFEAMAQVRVSIDGAKGRALEEFLFRHLEAEAG